MQGPRSTFESGREGGGGRLCFGMGHGSVRGEL